MSTCLITYLHWQPAISKYSFFDIGTRSLYSAKKNSAKYAKEYLKSNLLPVVKNLEANLSKKVTLFISLPLLDNLAENIDLKERLDKLIKNKQIELLGGSAFDSLSIIFSKNIFDYEVKKHKESLRKIFKVKPKGFVNSGLFYSDKLSASIVKFGFTYCLSPRIKWYINDDKQSVFQSKSGKLKLVLPTTSNGVAEDEPAKFIFDYNQATDLTNQGTELSLVADVIKAKDYPVYFVPDIIALDDEGKGAESLLGNNLQKDFLNRLIELGPVVARTEDDQLKEDFLWIGSINHFKLLSVKHNAGSAYSNYIDLLNMLYDIEIRLR